jgi:hypothetical protein
MQKFRIFTALLVLTILTLPMPRVLAAGNGQELLLQRTFPTESGERLKVNAYAGNVKINSWNKNEIEVKIYGSSEAGKYLDFDVCCDELGINIAALKKAEIENVKSLGLRYEISVPRDYDVRISGGENVTVEDKSGKVEMSMIGE